MSATVHGGPRVWSGGRDDDGYREYGITHLVKTTSNLDCPYTVMRATGLPVIGSVWNFGNEADIWAFCYPYMKVSRHQDREGDPHKWWAVEQKFSTKPLSRCQDTPVEDPLLEPQQVSGSFGKYTVEAVYDRHGNLIKSSSHEQIRGRQVEFDNNKPTVTIRQNVAALGLSTFSRMIDTVNSTPMWGLGTRRVKLSNAPWERKVFGKCYYYYTKTFEFDIDYNTFDRNALDEGTKALNGHWGSEYGSGLTVAITVDSDGGITGATIVDGGSGYPRSKTLYVRVIGAAEGGTATDGFGGVLRVTVDSSGVVASVAVVASGTSYIAGTVATESGQSWVLDDINGAPPDPDNAQHFIRYKDRNGENTRAILNGRGVPITDPSEAGRIDIEYYPESNFFTLGIPTSL